MPEHTISRSSRSYNQHCPVARSLDVVGERWTLLIIRDLLVGPKRYKELLIGAPGIGTNLLAARLHELEDLGIIRRTLLPPPAASTVYELTEAGLAMEPIIMDMGRWAMRFLPSPRESDLILPSAYFLGLRARFRPDAVAGLTQTYELHIDPHLFEIHIEHGRCTTTEGLSSHTADVVITTDMATLHDLLARRISADAAIERARISVHGDTRAVHRLVDMFAA